MPRVVALAAVVAVVVAAVGSYLAYLHSASVVVSGAPQQDQALLAPDAVLTESHIAFRSTALGPDHGRVGLVPLDHPGGDRALLALSCERVYATAGGGVCITAKRGVVQSYAIASLDAALRPVTSTPLAGLPSRARMSPDGSWVATTAFVTGHSYAQASFSTHTVVRHQGAAYADLESFTTLVNGRPLKAANRNFWGVTFDDDGDSFYATASSGNTTWLVRGSLSRRQMESLRTDAECPSLSPDGTKVAYKKRLGNHQPGEWRLAVLDLSSGRETLLAEPRSVDDQVEWLDQKQVLYAVPRQGAETTVSDVWAVSADGTGSARLLIEQASSPAVVRR